MIYDIPKPDISPGFTIEDIHKIREWNYERLKDATPEERKAEMERGAERTRRAIKNLSSNKKSTVTQYSIFIQYDEADNIFVATVAELKGCMAHGYTREEALKEIQDAIQLHLDALVDKGIDIPKPACLTV